MNGTAARPERPTVLVLSRCTSEFGRSRGGADVLSRSHAELLAEDGYPVVYVGTTPVDDGRVSSVIVRTRDLPVRGGPGGGDRDSLLYLLNEALHVVHGTLIALRSQRRHSVDILLSNSSIATLLLRALTSPRRLIYYVHDSLIPHGADPTMRRSFARWLANDLFERLAVRSAGRVICASDGIASQVQRTGVPREKLAVMYPLVHRRRAPEAAAPTREQIRAFRPFLLSVGQQTGRKRFDLLIEGLRDVPEPTRLVLVGDGPANASLRATARAMGVDHRVVFLTHASDSLRDALYQACSAYVLASENEGFPITIAEALDHGCPVFLACPSALGLEDLLEPEHSVLTHALRPDEIAHGMREVLARAGPDIESLRTSIRRWASRRLPSEEEIRRTYERIFSALLRASDDPGAPPSGPLRPPVLSR